MKTLACLLLVLGLAAARQTPGRAAACTQQAPSKPLLCYYEGRVPIEKSVYPCLCSHIVHTSAATIAEDFTLQLDPDVSRWSRALRARNPALKLLVSMGGQRSPARSERLTKSAEKRSVFAASVARALKDGGLQGVEVDLWLEPSVVPHKKEGLVELLKALRSELGGEPEVRTKRDYDVIEKSQDDVESPSWKPKKRNATSRLIRRTEAVAEKKNSLTDELDTINSSLLLLRVPIEPEIIVKRYDLKNITKYVDWFTVPTHNLTDPSEEGLTFHPSRLMGLADLLNTDSMLDLLTGLGAPHNRIIISVPASGTKFTLEDATKNTPRSPVTAGPERINQGKLCSLLSEGGWTMERDEDLTAPYAFRNNTWMAFDDHISAGIKGKYALLRDLAGAAIFPLDDDDVGGACAPFNNQSSTPWLVASLHDAFTRLARKSREVVLESLQDEIKQSTLLTFSGDLQLSPYRITRIVDTLGAVHVVRREARTQFECSRQGYFVHPLGCNRFYRCVKFNQRSAEFTVFEYDCPAGLAFDERWEVCVWPGSLPRGSPCTGSSEIAPVPRARYACPAVEGYYADPENCRWFFACLDHARDGLSPLTAYEFRCPFGLVFDERTLTCDWPWLVEGCGSGFRAGAYFGTVQLGAVGLGYTGANGAAFGDAASIGSAAAVNSAAANAAAQAAEYRRRNSAAAAANAAAANAAAFNAAAAGAADYQLRNNAAASVAAANAAASQAADYQRRNNAAAAANAAAINAAAVNAATAEAAEYQRLNNAAASAAAANAAAAQAAEYQRRNNAAAASNAAAINAAGVNAAAAEAAEYQRRNNAAANAAAVQAAEYQRRHNAAAAANAAAINAAGVNAAAAEAAEYQRRNNAAVSVAAANAAAAQAAEYQRRNNAAAAANAAAINAAGVNAAAAEAAEYQRRNNAAASAAAANAAAAQSAEYQRRNNAAAAANAAAINAAAVNAATAEAADYQRRNNAAVSAAAANAAAAQAAEYQRQSNAAAAANAATLNSAAINAATAQAAEYQRRNNAAAAANAAAINAAVNGEAAEYQRLNNAAASAAATNAAAAQAAEYQRRNNAAAAGNAAAINAAGVAAEYQRRNNAAASAAAAHAAAAQSAEYQRRNNAAAAANAAAINAAGVNAAAVEAADYQRRNNAAASAAAANAAAAQAAEYQRQSNAAAAANAATLNSAAINAATAQAAEYQRRNNAAATANAAAVNVAAINAEYQRRNNAAAAANIAALNAAANVNQQRLNNEAYIGGDYAINGEGVRGFVSLSGRNRQPIGTGSGSFSQGSFGSVGKGVSYIASGQKSEGADSYYRDRDIPSYASLPDSFVSGGRIDNTGGVVLGTHLVGLTGLEGASIGASGGYAGAARTGTRPVPGTFGYRRGSIGSGATVVSGTGSLPASGYQPAVSVVTQQVQPIPFVQSATPLSVVQSVTPVPIVQPAARIPIAQQVAQVPIVQSVTPASVLQPVSPISFQPAARRPVIQPVYNVPFVQSVTPAPVLQPVSPISFQPAARGPVIQPVANVPFVQSVTPAPGLQPVRPISFQPAARGPFIQPVSNVPFVQSVTPAPVLQPVSPISFQPAARRPVIQPVSNVPFVQSVTPAPVLQPVSPISFQPAARRPFIQPVANVPVFQSVTPAPVVQPVSTVSFFPAARRPVVQPVAQVPVFQSVTPSPIVQSVTPVSVVQPVGVSRVTAYQPIAKFPVAQPVVPVVQSVTPAPVVRPISPVSFLPAARHPVVQPVAQVPFVQSVTPSPFIQSVTPVPFVQSAAKVSVAQPVSQVPFVQTYTSAPIVQAQSINVDVPRANIQTNFRRPQVSFRRPYSGYSFVQSTPRPTLLQLSTPRPQVDTVLLDGLSYQSTPRTAIQQGQIVQTVVQQPEVQLVGQLPGATFISGKSQSTLRRRPVVPQSQYVATVTEGPRATILRQQTFEAARLPAVQPVSLAVPVAFQSTTPRPIYGAPTVFETKFRQGNVSPLGQQNIFETPVGISETPVLQPVPGAIPVVTYQSTLRPVTRIPTVSRTQFVQGIQSVPVIQQQTPIFTSLKQKQANIVQPLDQYTPAVTYQSTPSPVYVSTAPPLPQFVQPVVSTEFPASRQVFVGTTGSSFVQSTTPRPTFRRPDIQLSSVVPQTAFEPTRQSALRTSFRKQVAQAFPSVAPILAQPAVPIDIVTPVPVTTYRRPAFRLRPTPQSIPVSTVEQSSVSDGYVYNKPTVVFGGVSTTAAPVFGVSVNNLDISTVRPLSPAIVDGDFTYKRPASAFRSGNKYSYATTSSGPAFSFATSTPFTPLQGVRVPIYNVDENFGLRTSLKGGYDTQPVNNLNQSNFRFGNDFRSNTLLQTPGAGGFGIAQQEVYQYQQPIISTPQTVIYTGGRVGTRRRPQSKGRINTYSTTAIPSFSSTFSTPYPGAPYSTLSTTEGSIFRTASTPFPTVFSSTARPISYTQDTYASSPKVGFVPTTPLSVYSTYLPPRRPSRVRVSTTTASPITVQSTTPVSGGFVDLGYSARPGQSRKGSGSRTRINSGQDVNVLLDQYSGKFGSNNENFVNDVINGDLFRKQGVRGGSRGRITSTSGAYQSTTIPYSSGVYSSTTSNLGLSSSSELSGDNIQTDVGKTELGTATIYNEDGGVKYEAVKIGYGKTKGSKEPIVVVTRLSDVNPILVAKLGAQCTCRSNAVTLKKPSYSGGRTSAATTYSPIEYAATPTSFPALSYSSKYPASTLSSALSSTTPSYGGAELDSAHVVVTPRPSVIRTGLPTFASTTGQPSVDVEYSALLASGIEPDELNGSPSFQDVVASGRDSNTVSAKGSNVAAGSSFDRYGPGGLRGVDETLQGSVDCQRPGLFRHPKYCNKFYACHWDEWKGRYTLHVFNCPVQLAYDSDLGACNWPSQGPACADDNLLV